MTLKLNLNVKNVVVIAVIAATVHVTLLAKPKKGIIMNPTPNESSGSRPPDIIVTPIKPDLVVSTR